MNRDDIIRIAREAGLPLGFISEYGVRLAALVAAAEREACAKACDDLVLAYPGRADLTALQCADAIRARGQS